jgi:aminotransferase
MSKIRLSKREKNMRHGIVGSYLKLAVQDKNIISLGPGEPDFSTSKRVMNYGSKLLAKGYSTHYSPPGGRLSLKNKIVEDLSKNYNMNYNKNNIVVTSGSQEALMLGLISTIDPNDEVILPTPSYMGYIPTIQFLNGKVVESPTLMNNNFDLNTEDLRKRITKKTKGIILCNPSNPTGMIYSKKMLEELSDLVIENDLFVMSDECYVDLIYDNNKFTSFAKLNGMKKHSITLRSFSKSHAMCGFRVGYAVGPSNIIKEMTETHVNTTISAPTISQYMAEYALEYGRVHTNKMLKEYDKRRKLIHSGLNKIGYSTLLPQGAFYVFPKIDSNNSEDYSKKILSQSKIITIPGSEFGSAGEGHIRMSFATSKSNILTSINRLEKFNKKYI